MTSNTLWTFSTTTEQVVTLASGKVVTYQSPRKLFVIYAANAQSAIEQAASLSEKFDAWQDGGSLLDGRPVAVH